MTITSRMGVAILAGLVLGSAPAFADTCRTQTLPAVVRDLVKFEQTRDRAVYLQMGEAGEECPNDGWVRILLARAEMRAFDQLEPSTKRPDQLAPASFAYVERAAAHIDAYSRNMPDGSLTVDGRLLDLSLRSDIVRGVVGAMLRYADAGRVHPLISDTTPLPCTHYSGNLASEAWSYQGRNVGSEASFTLINRVVPACRQINDRLRTNPLIQRAQMIMRRIERDVVTDPEDIRRDLVSAARDVEIFKDGRVGAAGLWFDSHENQLKRLIAEHKIDLAAEVVAAVAAEAQLEKTAAITKAAPVDRSLWFTPQNAGSDGVAHAIAVSLNDLWSPLAAGTVDASPEERAAARNLMARYMVELRDEAKQKGVIDASRPAFKAALAAFQEGVVRTPETQGLPGQPQWLFESLIRVMDN